MNVFLDSSAIAKRYIDEPGSDRVEEILAAATSLAVSVICPVEVISALCRRRREGSVSLEQYERARESLFTDLEDAQVVAITGGVVRRAVELLERWPLRSADSLHVACAAEWQADLFVSADGRQCEAARGSGLVVEELPLDR